MKQLVLENMNIGSLPSGDSLHEGDIIEYSIAMSAGITRVVMHDGKLCMEENFMYGDKTPIDHFLRQASYNSVTKTSLANIYKKCKKNNWNTYRYIVKFGKKQF